MLICARDSARVQFFQRILNELLWRQVIFALITHLHSMRARTSWMNIDEEWIEGTNDNRNLALPPGGVTCLNTLRPRQNGHHFADDIFKWVFLNENVWLPTKIALKFVPKCLINNIPAFVQIMARRRPGDKPLSETVYDGYITDAYMRHSASKS